MPPRFTIGPERVGEIIQGNVKCLRSPHQEIGRYLLFSALEVGYALAVIEAEPFGGLALSQAAAFYARPSSALRTTERDSSWRIPGGLRCYQSRL